MGDKNYVTYLYVADGYLKEFTAEESYDFNYDTGAEILAVDDFSVKKESDSMYHFKIKDSNGELTEFFVTLYSGTDGEDDE